jgi:hypothetical protein
LLEFGEHGGAQRASESGDIDFKPAGPVTLWKVHDIVRIRERVDIPGGASIQTGL